MRANNIATRLNSLAERMDLDWDEVREDQTARRSFLVRYMREAGALLVEAIDLGALSIDNPDVISNLDSYRDSTIPGFHQVFLILVQHCLPSIRPELGGRSMRYPDDHLEPKPGLSSTNEVKRYTFPMRAFAELIRSAGHSSQATREFGEKGMTFDTFLSHNSNDKSIVRQLADALVARGLRPWLDERELVPGRPWQEALEDIIQTTNTAVVAFGPAGLGPWEEPEMRACLSEFVTRKLPVVPVLLPGAPKQPNLPLFLKAFTWVDLRGGLTGDGLDRLAWGITGQKPSSLGSPSNLDNSAVGPFVAELTELAKCNPRVQWLTSIISDCCLRFPTAINEDFHFEHLATCIEEAVDHGIQGAEEAGDRWGKTNSLQAVTLVLVGLAHAVKRSPQSLLLITGVCERLLHGEMIGLRLIWPADGKDELYRMAVDTNDPHDESVYEFLDANCQR